MSGKSLATGIVIGVVVAGVVCYIIYLENEKKKLKFENDLLKQRSLQNPVGNIISLNTVPEPVRKGFREAIQHHTPVIPLNHTFHESLKRVHFLKDIIENRDGYQIFYQNGKVFTKEKDLHIMYDLSWYKTFCDVNKEVNNGRGPVDFKVSNGLDKTLVEFKLASNAHLKKNLQNQVSIYQKANNNAQKIVAIVFTSVKQENRVKKILRELRLLRNKSVVLIDARRDNKPSASVA